MKNKFLAMIVLSGFCHPAISQVVPVPPPSIYSSGPTSPLLANSGLFVPEKAAYSLLNAALFQAQAVVSETSCASSAGVFNVTLYADGTTNDPSFNFVTVGSVTLKANIGPTDVFWGQTVSITQSAAGSLSDSNLLNYVATAVYNAESSIMLMTHTSSVAGINGLPVLVTGKQIKDYHQATDSSTGLPYIYDWGVQPLSKMNFPTENYWQRSKALRDDATIGRTVFEADRINGPNACQIILDISGYNDEDYFWQTGTLTIAPVPPSPEYQFDF